MNKEELIKAIAERKGLNFEAVAEDLSFAYDEIFAQIVQTVAEGKTVQIPGFGTFYRTKKHLGRTRMHSTKMVPTFSPDLDFKDAVHTNWEV